MINTRALALIVFAAAVICGLIGWLYLQPFLEDGWLPTGVAIRVFLPVLILFVISAWLWMRS